MNEKGEKMEKELNNIIFTKEIDDAINGYALSITFIAIGIFLLNNLNYFGNQIVSIIILSIFTVIGILGTFVELSKKQFLKGIGELIVGFIFFVPWLLLYIFVNNIWANVISFICLIIGAYGLTLGVIKLGYSIVCNAKTSNKMIRKIIINIFKILPALASFVLVIFNIIKIIMELNNL